MLGEAASPEVRRALERAVQDHPLALRLIHMRTEHLGPEDVLVGAKVEFSRSLDVEGLARAIDSLEASMRRAVPGTELTIYVEPDVFREDHPVSGRDRDPSPVS